METPRQPISTHVTGTPYLDAVEAELRQVSPGLRGRAWERTPGNALDTSQDDPASWILQVPDCWGWTRDSLCPQGADKPGIKKLLAKLLANISRAERTVDITAWGPPNMWPAPAEPFPDGLFAETMCAGLRVAAKAAVTARRRLTVRILTGVLSGDITASPWSFRDYLKRMIGDDFSAIDLNVASMTTRGAYSYNHTKLVVVDGVFVIHGGINWMTNYYIKDGSFGSRGFGDVAPVADLDIALCGPAACSAGKFLDELWTWTSENASTTWQPNVKAWLATNNDKLDECKPKLYGTFVSPSLGNLQVISVGSLGYGILDKDPISEYQPPSASNMDQAACGYWMWGQKSNNQTNTDRDFMTVNPDANALRALIGCARQKIVLSQQDINGFSQFPLYHALFDVRPLDILVTKMMASPPVKVRIVLSNPGYPDYSNISHINQARDALFARVRLRTRSDGEALAVMNQSLQLAPLRLSDQPTWPNGSCWLIRSARALAPVSPVIWGFTGHGFESSCGDFPPCG